MRLVSRAAVSLALIAVLVSVPAANADDDIPSLVNLLDAAEHIVIGVVATVGPGTARGSLVATIDVEEVLRGTPPASLALRGSTRKPGEPSFVAGARILIFLRAAPGGGLEPVDGAAGIFQLPPGSVDAGRSIVRKFGLVAAPPVSLTALRPELVRAAAAPRVLIAAALTDLAPGLGPADHPLLTEIACDARDEFLRSARLWAIGEAGRVRAASARACLEQMIGAPDARDLQLASSEALGDLADARSLPALVAVLSAAPPRSDDPRSRRSDGGLTLSAVLAIGKIGDPSAVSLLRKLARERADLALGSTVVHALGLIGGPDAVAALTGLMRNHPDGLVRDQAQRTLARLTGGQP